MNNQDIKKAGLKVTTPRKKILDILTHAEKHHMSAEAIYQSLAAAGEDVGLATVYRVLTQFEEAGLVTRHYFEGDQSVFELNQGEHHDHLVCTQCAKVEEFFDETIENRLHSIAEKANYQVTAHSLNIYGLCPECQGK